ncbi:uncharacterized protein LOC123537471 [Mercenaria mercenaria]|uniref:uncharacterized protein LOC123537471 n=1 Tax=Mercenaria mercenaria TaxID=6596 RepID=UPI00234EB98A|nr:uncharacterized protein LOC123537471 [Mercenaria mercenaria]
MANMLLGTVAALLLIYNVGAILETNHLIEIDNDGRRVAMDVSYDTEKNTVLVIVGDVSKYKDGVQTVNLHDFNTKYGVLKDINKKTCLLGKAFTPRAMPEKYRMGVTNEVHPHMLDISPDVMTKEEVYDLGGPHIAAFCNDYDTYFVKGTPLTGNKMKVAGFSSRGLTSMWCVVSSCFVRSDRYDQLS